MTHFTKQGIRELGGSLYDENPDEEQLPQIERERLTLERIMVLETEFPDWKKLA